MKKHKKDKFKITAYGGNSVLIPLNAKVEGFINQWVACKLMNEKQAKKEKKSE